MNRWIAAGSRAPAVRAAPSHSSSLCIARPGFRPRRGKDCSSIGSFCEITGQSQDLGEDFGQVCRQPDYRILNCAAVKNFLAAIWQNDSDGAERRGNDPTTLHAMTEINLRLLEHSLMALARRKNLDSNKRQLGASDLIVAIISSFSRIDADIWCVIDAAHREREFVIDRELLLRAKFESQICLDSSMVAAGHRFASFFFIG